MLRRKLRQRLWLNKSVRKLRIRHSLKLNAKNQKTGLWLKPNVKKKRIGLELKLKVS